MLFAIAHSEKDVRVYEHETYDPPLPPHAQTNTLGIVGFVLSFCISPIGLILSLIALARPPRGFAIAGTVIGVLGSCVWGGVIFFALAFGEAFMEMWEITSDYEQIARAVTAHQANNQGQLPPDLASLNLPADVLTDPGGQPYIYTVDAEAGTWTLTVAGLDGVPGTSDDIDLPGDLSSAEVNEVLGRAIQEQLESGR